jgi:hypothetical protein
MAGIVVVVVVVSVLIFNWTWDFRMHGEVGPPLRSQCLSFLSSCCLFRLARLGTLRGLVVVPNKAVRNTLWKGNMPFHTIDGKRNGLWGAHGGGG